MRNTPLNGQMQCFKMQTRGHSTHRWIIYLTSKRAELLTSLFAPVALCVKVGASCASPEPRRLRGRAAGRFDRPSRASRLVWSAGSAQLWPQESPLDVWSRILLLWQRLWHRGHMIDERTRSVGRRNLPAGCHRAPLQQPGQRRARLIHRCCKHFTFKVWDLKHELFKIQRSELEIRPKTYSDFKRLGCSWSASSILSEI